MTLIPSFSFLDLFNTLIKDLTEELSHDENNYNNTDVLEEKRNVLEADSAKNIPQNEMKITFPQVKLEFFFHDILEGPKLEINEIRDNENRVLNNEKYGSHGILESLNREDDEDDVDCSSEKGCMYVQYTLSSKFSDATMNQENEKNKNKRKSMCEDDNNMEGVIWDDNDALCIVAVSGPESLVPGTPLYMYAEEPYELFEYTEEPRCVSGRSPSLRINPLAVAGNSTSFSSSSSTFSKNSLHGYMRLPLPMHSGWYVVSYVRTYIVGIERNHACDDNENDDEGNNNDMKLVDTNVSEETVKSNIPSIIIRKRIELGKSELFSIEVPVQGIGEDVLLPCNKGVRRRGAGYLGGPIWEGTGPMGKIVKMLDVTVEDLKSIKTLSLTISLPRVEKNRNFEYEKFDEDGDVCVDIDSQKSTESILCRAMIWAYDVKKEEEEEKIGLNSGKKLERETYENKNFDSISYDNNIDDDNDKNDNNNNHNNCKNDDDKNDNNDNKMKQRTVLRTVVEADVITIHRNNGVVTVESVCTAYGILNIDDNDVIQSILNNSKFDHMNENMPRPSSKTGRIIPSKLSGSTGSINRYGQFISRIFYGEHSGGNIPLKDTVSPYSKDEKTVLPLNPKTNNQVKSDLTDSVRNPSLEIDQEEKEKYLNIDKERNMNKNTDININTDIKEIMDTNTDIDIDISCGFCNNQLVPLGEINENVPMPSGEFDDVRT